MLSNTEIPNRPPLFDAVGCICTHSARLLLLQRHSDKSFPHHWGIPTGKVERNESRPAAITRELFEETGILVSQENLQFVEYYYIANQSMSFRYFVYATTFETRPAIQLNATEHTSFVWITLAEAKSFPLVPDLYECLLLAQKLLLPDASQLSLFPETLQSTRPNIGALQARATEDLPRWSGEPPAKPSGPRTLVFGPPGSGKSTAIKRIRRANGELLYYESRTILSRGTRLNNYLRRLFEDHDSRWFLAFQVDALVMRFWHALEAQPYSIVEQGPISILAYSKALLRLGWISPDEYETFYALYATLCQFLPFPTNAVHMTADPHVLLARIVKRGRRHEAAAYSAEYLSAIRSGMLEASEELGEHLPVQMLDTSCLSKRAAADRLNQTIGRF